MPEQTRARRTNGAFCTSLFMMLAFTSFVWLVLSEIMEMRYELVEPDEMGEYHD